MRSTWHEKPLALPDVHVLSSFVAQTLLGKALPSAEELYAMVERKTLTTPPPPVNETANTRTPLPSHTVPTSNDAFSKDSQGKKRRGRPRKSDTPSTRQSSQRETLLSAQQHSEKALQEKGRIVYSQRVLHMVQGLLRELQALKQCFDDQSLVHAFLNFKQILSLCCIQKNKDKVFKNNCLLSTSFVFLQHGSVMAQWAEQTVSQDDLALELFYLLHTVTFMLPKKAFMQDEWSAELKKTMSELKTICEPAKLNKVKTRLMLFFENNNGLSPHTHIERLHGVCMDVPPSLRSRFYSLFSLNRSAVPAPLGDDELVALSRGAALLDWCSDRSPEVLDALQSLFDALGLIPPFHNEDHLVEERETETERAAKSEPSLPHISNDTHTHVHAQNGNEQRVTVELPNKVEIEKDKATKPPKLSLSSSKSDTVHTLPQITSKTSSETELTSNSLVENTLATTTPAAPLASAPVSAETSLDLPEVRLRRWKEVFLKYFQIPTDERAIFQTLKLLYKLKEANFTIKQLQETGVGHVVNQLTWCDNVKVRTAATAVKQKWFNIFTREKEINIAKNAFNNIAVPSSSREIVPNFSLSASKSDSVHVLTSSTSSASEPTPNSTFVDIPATITPAAPLSSPAFVSQVIPLSARKRKREEEAAARERERAISQRTDQVVDLTQDDEPALPPPPPPPPLAAVSSSKAYRSTLHTQSTQPTHPTQATEEPSLSVRQPVIFSPSPSESVPVSASVSEQQQHTHTAPRVCVTEEHEGVPTMVFMMDDGKARSKFRMATHKRLEKLFKRYAKTNNRSAEHLEFFYEGKRLNPHCVLRESGLSHNDTIEVKSLVGKL